ncbi:MAG: hypothetical protein J07HQW1_00110, partial [Haloquadratum walsbyi J07HQW1]
MTSGYHVTAPLGVYEGDFPSDSKARNHRPAGRPPLRATARNAAAVRPAEQLCRDRLH